MRNCRFFRAFCGAPGPPFPVSRLPRAENNPRLPYFFKKFVSCATKSVYPLIYGMQPQVISAA